MRAAENRVQAGWAYTPAMLLRAMAWYLLAMALIAVGCSSDGDDPAPTATATAVPAASYAERGPHSVGVTTLQLVDTSRGMPPNGDFAGAFERPMAVDVWYPAAASSEPEVRDAPLTGGPYPLIVFAHGFLSSRGQSASYTQHLASHGYVVVSPDFPGSNTNAPGGPRLRGVIDQPRDVSFVIDEMLRRNDEIDGPFAGAIDAERIGMTGHSLGGLTTMMTVFGPMRDERIDAAAPISALGCFLPDGWDDGVATPVMVVGGSEELVISPASIRRAYDVIDAPKYHVELSGADHIKFADVDLNDRDVGGGDIVTSIAGEHLTADAIAVGQVTGGNAALCADDSGQKGKEYLSGDRQRELLRIFGALFFDAHLRGNEGAVAALRGDLSGIAPEAVVEFE